MASCSRPYRTGRGSSPSHPNQRVRGIFFDRRPGRGGGGRGTGGGRGLVNYTRAYQDPREIREMPYRRLLELNSMGSENVLLTLQDANCGFVELMNMAALGSEVLIPIIGVLASACRSTLYRQNLVKLITDTCNSRLASDHLPKYLSKVQHMDNIGKMAFLRDMTVPLKTFLKGALGIVPTLAAEKLELCVTIFQTCFGTVLQQLPDSISAEYQDVLKEMEDMRKTVLQPYIELEKENKRKGVGQPPQNFREMAIAPSAAELNGDADPFLQKNIVSGRYRNGEHYLDVQFRLLREDFVGPLREAIKKYKEIIGAAGKDEAAIAKALKEMKEMDIYRHVQVQSPDFTGSGMVYVLWLDITVMCKIDWEDSKRLLPGSLLCISNDDFENIALAVVVQRDVAKLSIGLLSVQIIEGRAIVDDPNAQGFVLAESPAYFEAYSPILKALQTLEGYKLPFSKYIININTNIVPPKYIYSPYMCFDLSPLLCGFKDEDKDEKEHGKEREDEKEHKKQHRKEDEKEDGKEDEDENEKEHEDEDEKEDEDKESLLIVPQRTYEERVPILQTDKWPDKEKFGLDESQYDALQAALTRELAIIQGPPGTGKTFLGLKVVQALLYNKDAWQHRRAPILTVCLTNHALDQFLEGILDQVGNKDIVRVGGRSKSEKLGRYNLKQQRFDRESLKRSCDEEYVSETKTIRKDMKMIDEKIAEQKKLLNTFWHKVSYEIKWYGIMNDEHRQQMDNFEKRSQAKCGILVWLGGAVTLADLDNAYQEITHPLDISAEGIAASSNILDTKYEQDGLVENQPILDTDDLQDMFGRITLEDRLDYNDDIMDTEEMYNGGWQVPAVQMVFRKILRRRMMSMDVMTEKEVKCVKHLDDLMPRDRWRLYRYWVFKLRDVYQAHLDFLQWEYGEKSRILNELEMEEDIDIIRNATVVGMTTTGAAKHQIVLQAIKPQIVIVEEAAEVLEAHIITSLTEDCDHLILIGDHQQLRPNTNMYNLARRYKLDVSLFERMINNEMPFETLKLQHRMRPEISHLLVPNIYKELLNHPSVENRPQIRGVEHSVYFINHGMQESNASDSASKENLFEADYAAALCRHLLLQGYDGEKITVLTAYVGQMNQLKKRMKDPVYKGVHITVVDNYQGEENDIIILSLVRSNAENRIGFLKIENRVCVALSRARNGLFVIGNFDFMMENGGDVWNQIVGHLTTAGLIGPALRLVCENHTNDVVEALSAEDFEKAPEGGCTRPCEALMVCGHLCPLPCHYYDTEHVTERTHCHKPCEKILCERGHGCKRMCFEDCGECNVLIEVVMPVCGHMTKLRCSEDPKKAQCFEICNRDRPCGHKCLDRCHTRCSDMCNTHVDVDGPCGHVVHLPCCKKEDMKTVKESCRELCTITLNCGHINQLPCCKKDDMKWAEQRCLEHCETTLDCGHQCTGTCGRCHQGLFHISCTRRCQRRLVCGHLCTAPCAVACPPCTMQCANRCIHSKCRNKCGIPCKPCLQKCPWQCAHYKCTQPCWKECDRPPCQEPCRLTLACGHQCIGMCGEPCPKICRVCDLDESFADEDERARFVELVDCGHIIEVIAMDQWMNSDKGEKEHEEVNMKGCPKCKTVVGRSLRYGSQVKRTMNDVAKIKRRVFGRLQSKATLSEELTKQCNSLYTSLKPYVRKIIPNFKESLVRESIPHSQYSLLKNLFMLANKPCDILEKVPARYRSAIQETVNGRLQEIMGWILQMIPLNDDRCGSEQRMNQVARELTRVAFLSKLLEIPKNGHLNEQAGVLYDDVMASVNNSLKPFTPEIEKAVIKCINDMKKIQGDTELLKEEKIEVVKALDMECGHWFKCPNGHLYAITEGGFVYEKESCNECNPCQTSP